MKTDDLDQDDLEMLNTCLSFKISGKIGKFVFYQMNGKTQVRRAPKKRDPATWTERQLDNHKRFTALTRHARSLSKTVIEPIWNNAGKPKKKSGYNLFLKANNPAFDATGQVPDPKLLHFSTGPLGLPGFVTTTVKPGNPNSVSVEWNFDDKRDGQRYEDDCLMCVQYPSDSIEVVNTGFTRKDKMASIELPASEDKNLFLFLFFWNKSKNRYSPDQAFLIR